MSARAIDAERPWLAHYDPGVPASLEPYPDRILLDFFEDALRERPGHTMAHFMGREFLVRELAEQSDALAAALAGLGVSPGDRVAAMLPNCPQFYVAELATWKLGAIFAPLNPIYSEDELIHPLNTIDTQIVVTLNPFYERLKRVQAKTPVTRIITTNIKEYFPPLLRLAFTLFKERAGGHRITPRDGDLTLAGLLEKHRGLRVNAQRPRPTDIALLLMSGGTTGEPKCVMGEHRALVMSGLQLKTWLGEALTDWTSVYMMPLPLFHSYGACAVQGCTFIGHNPIALVPNPRDLNDVVKTISRVRPTAFAGVPTLYNALVNHPTVKAGRVDFSSLRVCASGAAPLLSETRRRFEAATGAHIIEGYGLTESLIAAIVNPVKGPSKDGSIGMPVPDVVVKIVDADDPTKPVSLNEVGEMLLRAPQIMPGYWRNPEGTKEMVWIDAAGVRWLRTGDLGRMDEDGYVFLTDRKKELIKANGMQVWPRELEEAIATHPAVADVGVRGFPDPAHGEIAVAFVVLREGQHATEADIREYCKKHLAYYKVPAKVVFRSELPKSMVGKVLRRMLALDDAESVATRGTPPRR